MKGLTSEEAVKRIVKKFKLPRLVVGKHKKATRSERLKAHQRFARDIFKAIVEYIKERGAE